MSFDYGKTLSDGQYENYPTSQEGEFVAPIRNMYKHSICGGLTWCSDGIAETYAKNPTYYTRTYCSSCQDHFPISEFSWHVDDVTLGEIGDNELAGKDMRSKSGYIR